MERVKYLILGAGPCGLTLANKLKQSGETSFLVVEKETQAGGLCRSMDVDGAPLDIGGGHFLDVRRPKVCEFVFSFMPKEEWDYFERDSQIHIDNDYVHHPLEANIFEMSLENQVEYLKSVSLAGSNLGTPMPTHFVDWIRWKLGDRIAEHYMLPYNQKMFADDLNSLGTYWLEKLPNVSFDEILLSCLTKKAHGSQPGHASFYYPKKYGYGEVFIRMADAIKDNIIYNSKICKLDFNTRKVTTSNGKEIIADQIITTIPWTSIETFEGADADFMDALSKLRHSSIEVRYFNQNLDTSAQWIYYPEDSLPYHRILVRHNFCESRGYWTETRKERTDLFGKEDGSFKYMNEYAYPINTIDKPEAVKTILDFANKHNIYGLGRWGEHSHYNSDVVVEKALNYFDCL